MHLPARYVGHLRALLCGLALALSLLMRAQAPDTLRPVKAREVVLLAGGAALMAGSLISLDQAWYSQYERVPFHFFNDGAEWYQMDKVGHAFTAYQLGRFGYGAFHWAGLSRKTEIWAGGGIGLLYLTGIEYLDGRSSAWGFSGWDMVANGAGAGLFIGQQLAWGDQRLLLKYSAHTTKYAEARPDLLGEGLSERLLKDYNGTTIWVSANLRSFGCTRSPVWLNVALGYGAEGMVSARNMDRTLEARFPGEHPYRQFYLSPDISFSRIATRSRTLHTVLSLLDCIKLPLPTLELRSNGVLCAHALYF